MTQALSRQLRRYARKHVNTSTWKKAHKAYRTYRDKSKQGRKNTSFLQRNVRAKSSFNSRSVMPGTRNFTHGANDRDPGVSKKRVRGVDYKRPKRVKVNKSFKLKVNKAMQGKTYSGFFQHTTYYFLAPPTAVNTQGVFPANYENTTELFSPQQFLNAASVLWNGKQFLAAGTPSNINDIGNFNPFETKIDVIKTWAVAQMRNNSKRTLYIKMYDCKAKSLQNSNFPLAQWNNALVEMNQTKGASTAFSENPRNTLSSTLHANPKSLIQFNKWWACEVTNIVLEPGQTYDYKITGPSNMTVDMSKYYNSGNYQQISKCGRYVFGTIYTDLENNTIAGASGQAGRFGEAALDAGVDIEYNVYYSLSIPEKAGFIGVGTAGAGTELGERHNSYVIQNDAVAYTNTTATRIDVENPVTSEANP